MCRVEISFQAYFPKRIPRLPAVMDWKGKDNTDIKSQDTRRFRFMKELNPHKAYGPDDISPLELEETTETIERPRYV